MTDEQIEAEARASYAQFLSSKPHESSYVSGFIVGAFHVRHEMGERIRLITARHAEDLRQAAEATRDRADLRARLAAVTQERNRLREAALEILDCPYDDADRWESAMAALDAALAAPADAGKEVAGG